MTEMSNMPMEPDQPEPFYQIWIRALTRPEDATYAGIASSANVNPNIAYLWLFLTGLISSIFSIALQGTSMRQLRSFLPPEAAQAIGGGQSFGTILIGAICGAPFAAAFGVLFFAIIVALIQWIAKMFGGHGDYRRMVYTLACIASPLNLVVAALTLLGAIPFIGFLFGLISFVVGIYALFLYVVAVKGVNAFGWGAALGSVLLPVLVFIFLCACVVIGGLAILGSAFYGINQSLGAF